MLGLHKADKITNLTNFKIRLQLINTKKIGYLLFILRETK